MNTVSNIDNLLVSLGQTGTPVQTGKWSADAKSAGVSFMDVLQNFAASLTSQSTGAQAVVAAPTAESTDMPAWLSALLTVLGPNTLATTTPAPSTGEALAGTMDEISASLTDIMAAVQTVVDQNTGSAAVGEQALFAAPVTGDELNSPADQNEINLVNTMAMLAGAIQMPAPLVVETAPAMAAADNTVSAVAPASVAASGIGQAYTASMAKPANQQNMAAVVVSPSTETTVTTGQTTFTAPDSANTVANAADASARPVVNQSVANAAATTATNTAPATESMVAFNQPANGNPASAMTAGIFARTLQNQPVNGNTRPATTVETQANPATATTATAQAQAVSTATAPVVTSSTAPATIATASSSAATAPVTDATAQKATIAADKANIATSTTFARMPEKQSTVNTPATQPSTAQTTASTQPTVAAASFTVVEKNAAPAPDKEAPASSADLSANVKVEASVSPVQGNNTPAVVATTAPETTAAPQQAVPMRDIPALKQIGESVKLFQQGTTSVRMHLQPEELGQVLVQLKVVNGEISVQVLTESAKTQALIQDNLSQLKTAFNDQGLNTNYLEVALGSDASAFSNSHQQAGQWANQNRAAKQSNFAVFSSNSVVDAPIRNRAESISGRVDYQI